MTVLQSREKGWGSSPSLIKIYAEFKQILVQDEIKGVISYEGGSLSSTVVDFLQ